MALRVFLRSDRDRAQRDRAADLVQEARLDLIAAGLAACLLAGPALAQEGPLTTLLRPQPLTGSSLIARPERLLAPDPLASPGRLFGDDPLASVNALTGAGSLSDPRAAVDPSKPRSADGSAPACERPRRPGDPPQTPRMAYGGSGAGEYGRYMNPGGAAATGATTGRTTSATISGASGTRPSGALPADRPLYGGTDRPLWGERAPPSRPEAAERDEPLSQARPDQPLWAGAAPERLPPCPEPGRAAATPPARRSPR